MTINTTTAAAVLSGDSAATAATAATGDTTAQTTSQDPWYASHPDENVRNWATNKAWPDPMAALESGYNLEKLIGFEKAGRTVALPKDDATTEEKAAFFQKLGAPEKPDGYKLPETLAQDPLAQQFRDVAHKNGMLPKQFDETLSWYTAEVTKMQTEQEQQRAVQGEQDMATLKTEWGQAFDHHIELGKRAAANFIPAKNPAERVEILSKIEAAIGTGAMMRMFSRIGEGLGEHKVHDNGESGNFGAMTPGAAKAKIEALKQDKEWSNAYLKGDAAKKSEMARLIAFAFPE